MSYLYEHKRSGLTIGDKVKIIGRCTSNHRGWNNYWTSKMDDKLEKEGIIINDYGNKGFLVLFDKFNKFEFPYFVLKKIKNKKEYNMNYKEEHKKSGFKVGDRIKVIREPDSHEMAWGYCSCVEWLTEMKALIGNTYQIKEDNANSGFKVEHNNNNYYLPYFLIEKVGEIDINNYEIPKPFSIIDIYEKRPFTNVLKFEKEFLELLKEQRKTSINDIWYSINIIKDSEVLMRNLDWLESEGFIKEKENICLYYGDKVTFKRFTYKIIKSGSKTGILFNETENSICCLSIIEFSVPIELNKLREIYNLDFNKLN